MFKLTEAAAKQVQVAAREGGAEGMALRMAAQRTEDGSIQYLMGFDEGSEADFRASSHGVTVLIAPEYLPLLNGATMDYVEMEQGEHRFIFLNPNDDNYIEPIKE